MNCDEATRLLDAYIDGELELTQHLDLEAHLAACTTCKKAAEAAMNFGSSIRMNMPVYNAPPKLKARIRAALRKEFGSQFDWFSDFHRLLAMAAAIVVLGLLLAWAWIAVSHGRDQELIAEAVSDHSRSLLVNHLLDVTSPDPHVVKPWFNGKLHYPPPIADLRQAGYKLVGGRIDLLANRPVAAIVYEHENRFINVFVWPVGGRAIDFDVQSHEGYSLCGWNKSGLNYLIVSELTGADMEKFEDQFRAQTD
jgi:anti-sigma factor RsiW